jgi:nucleoside-diphosphate-sugar epimerase
VKQDFAAIILGGTGQVGGEAVAELLATSECREVVIVTRSRQRRELSGCRFWIGELERRRIERT